MVAKKVSIETQQKIVQMYQDGQKREYIAAVCHVSKGTVDRYARVANIPGRRLKQSATTSTPEVPSNSKWDIYDSKHVKLGNAGIVALTVQIDNILFLSKVDRIWLFRLLELFDECPQEAKLGN